MKTTKIMLVFLGTLLLTWLTVGFVAWIFANQLGYKECLVHGPTIVTMIILGWIPAVVVSLDYEEHYG